MKARALKKILNNTGYTVSHREEYICVGSPMCHNLISVDVKTLKLSYALDIFHDGRAALTGKSKDELLFIWDTLSGLIETGEILDIINGQDIIENPLPVFLVEDGKIIETVTDAYGWPNTTIDGTQLFDNTSFQTKAEAIEYALNDNAIGVKQYKSRLYEIEEQWKMVLGELDTCNENIKVLLQMKNEFSGT